MKIPHPSHSLNLAPFDFFLFGVKQLFRRAEFPDRNSLFDAVVPILTGRGKVTLKDVFLSWIDRLRSYVAAHGDYIEETKFLFQWIAT